jgi:hypothetical protein
MNCVGPVKGTGEFSPVPFLMLFCLCLLSFVKKQIFHFAERKLMLKLYKPKWISYIDFA